MADSRTKTLIKDTAWFAIGNFGSRVLSLLLVPLYTSVLSTEEYGTADILNTTVNLAVPILTLSVQDATFRFALDKNINLKGVFTSSFFIALISPAILVLMYPVINLFLPVVGDYWWYFIAIYCGHSLSGLLGNFLKATNKTHIFAAQGILYTFLFAGLNIVFLVVVKIGIAGYLLSFVLSYLASCFFMFVAGGLYQYLSISCIDKPLLKEMLRYSMPLIPAAIAWWIMSSIDKYMLLYMKGTESTGLYGVAHKIPTVVTTVMTFFVNSWQITAVRSKDDSDISSYVSNMYKILVGFGILFTYVLVLLSQPLGKFMFAKEFYPAWTMSASLCVATLISTLSLILGAQFTACKRSDLHLKSNLISMGANIVLNYFLITLLGINGAAYGTMLSFFIVMIYRHYKVKQLIDFQVNAKKIYVCFLLLMGSAVVTGFDVPYYYVVVLMAFAVSTAINFNEVKSIISFFIKQINRHIPSRT